MRTEGGVQTEDGPSRVDRNYCVVADAAGTADGHQRYRLLLDQMVMLPHNPRRRLGLLSLVLVVVEESGGIHLIQRLTFLRPRIL